MKAKALKSFVGKKPYAEGEVFDLPPGVDWLKCGLAEKVSVKRKAPAKRKPKSVANK